MWRRRSADKVRGGVDSFGNRGAVSALQLNGARSFSLSAIKKLTDDFSENNMIGEGFTKVYKATLPNGQVVAVKRDWKADTTIEEEHFRNEIDILSSIRHVNLVRLVGFCCEKGERVIISEFVPNGNLSDCLSGKTGIRLSWIDRLRIALGTARGVAYLHEFAEPPIIHGDVKSSSILLDASLRPRVTDFGLSRINLGEEDYVAGTPMIVGAEISKCGFTKIISDSSVILHLFPLYNDPEYLTTGKVTDKCDVYGFGLVMLELLTGQTAWTKIWCPATGKCECMIDMVINMVKTSAGFSGGMKELIDPVIRDEPVLPGLERFVNVALWCVQDLRINRPAMREVVKEIESILENINLDLVESGGRDKIGAHPFANWETPNRSDVTTALLLDGVASFSLTDIMKFTANFSTENKIGTGGYGEVYKGKLPTGQAVAIKRAKSGSMQGAREFETEIELLSRVHHVNLVRLVGFCDKQGEQVLVYEFIPNGTLDDCLSGKNEIRLSWIDRLRIAVGSASGLAYLHEHANPPIIHRDVKAANILLDESYVPKVADFGISTLAKKDWTANIMGTFGYLDPEYCFTQRVSNKIDVYSFGVVMLVLLTARKPIENDEHISTKVRAALQSSVGVRKIVDPTIQDPTILFGAARFADLALRCVDRDDANRPSMRVVVKEIESILETVLCDASASSSQVHIGPY